MERVRSLNAVKAFLKPAGETSAQTVQRIKTAVIQRVLGDCKKQGSRGLAKKLNKMLKVGHGGTLDPMATGILVIGVGGGCKRLGTFLKNTKKGYKFEGIFGVHYDTLDVTGKLIEEKASEHIKGEEIERVLQKKFTGTIEQIPPAFSAIHVNGVRSHKLARDAREKQSGAEEHGGSERPTVDEKAHSTNAAANAFVEDAPPPLPARQVTIHDISLLSYAHPKFTAQVECGSGTYVRSIVRDIGLELGSCAAMSALERTRQGSFEIEDCTGDLDVFVEGILKS